MLQCSMEPALGAHNPATLTFDGADNGAVLLV
jgi:hypothetical protein